MDFQNEHKDFIERCKKMCEQAGKSMPMLVYGNSSELSYRIREYETHPDDLDSREALENLLGEMWIGLMCLMLYYNVDFDKMSAHMDEQLGR